MKQLKLKLKLKQSEMFAYRNLTNFFCAELLKVVPIYSVKQHPRFKPFFTFLLDKIQSKQKNRTVTRLNVKT